MINPSSKSNISMLRIRCGTSSALGAVVFWFLVASTSTPALADDWELVVRIEATTERHNAGSYDSHYSHHLKITAASGNIENITVDERCSKHCSSYQSDFNDWLAELDYPLEMNLTKARELKQWDTSAVGPIIRKPKKR